VFSDFTKTNGMNVDLQVINRFLDGHEQEGDKELILEWFSDISAEYDLRRKYKTYWDEMVSKQDLEGYDGEKILDRIYHQIKLKESHLQPRNKGLIRFVNMVTKVAAVLFIPLMAYAFLTRDHKMLADNQMASSEIYSPPGTRTMFYLPDGSKGWLNGGSYLEFPTEFKGRSREVVLKGEAYFEVRANKRKPFIVSGSHITVAAHGTSFSVMAFPEEEVCEVTLATGSIKVWGKKNGINQNARMLQSDQMYIYDLSTSTSRVVAVDAAQIICWKEGKLVFKNDSLEEVIKRLNRWYNVNIIIMDESLKSYVYLATFEDETLDEVLKLLEYSAPIRYKDLGRKRNEDGTFTKRKIELYYNP
jgi:transmembrane sensor